MERLIVDTGVLVRAERTGAAGSLPVADDDDIVIAAITAAELLVGVARADGGRRSTWERFVERVLETLPAVDYGLAVARVHAELLAHTIQHGTPRGAHDLIIAATAKAEGRTLLTTDLRGFDALPGVTVRVV